MLLNILLAYFLAVFGHIAHIISQILDEAMWFSHIEYTNNAIQVDIHHNTQVEIINSLKVSLVDIEAEKNPLETILQATIIIISILSFFNY